MIPNNNFSVLPWYYDIPAGYGVQQQNHNLSYAYGDIYPLFTPARYLPPFQIMRNTVKNKPLTRFEIYDKTGKSMFGNIVTELINSGTQIVRFASLGYDIIVYPGYLPMNINIPAFITPKLQTVRTVGRRKCSQLYRILAGISKLNGTTPKIWYLTPDKLYIKTLHSKIVCIFAAS